MVMTTRNDEYGTWEYDEVGRRVAAQPAGNETAELSLGDTSEHWLADTTR